MWSIVPWTNRGKNILLQNDGNYGKVQLISMPRTSVLCYAELDVPSQVLIPCCKKASRQIVPTQLRELLKKC